MATAKEKVLRVHPRAKAEAKEYGWSVFVPNVAPGMRMPLGWSSRRESWAWADAWRTIQEATNAMQVRR